MRVTIVTDFVRVTKLMNIMDLNPVKDCGGREEKKRDKKILVDADSCHLKAPDDGHGNCDYH